MNQPCKADNVAAITSSNEWSGHTAWMGSNWNDGPTVWDPQVWLSFSLSILVCDATQPAVHISEEPDSVLRNSNED
jgi:hypothetical protein